ncbi:MAG: hypothetical protein ACFB0B_09275 [Thermonemataceae bacterium]
MFYTNGIGFESLETVLKVYKKQARPLEEVLAFFSQEDNRKQVQQVYETLPPITIKEALALGNTEQRMIVLRIFTPEEVAQDLPAEKIDSQTIKKKQIRWDENLKPYEYVYEDTYTLHKIAAKELGVKERSWWVSPDIFFVQCQCTSTDRMYYLYVPPEAAENGDAIEAIAWTMQIEGQPLTKQQYLNLMYTET